MSNRKVGWQQRDSIFARPRRKAGRPTKSDLEQRARLKAQAAKDDEVRALIEESIARGEDVSDIVFPAPPPSSPAMAFLIKRLWGVPVERADAALKDALRDLLRSDLALDPKSRREVFDLYTRTDEQKRLGEDRAFIGVFEDHKKYLRENRGMTAIEAEEFIAAARGWTRGTLLKNLQRARKRLRKATK
jgi:hypothetical protein